MVESKRVFILGAGFSKPAGMPLATELIPLLLEKTHDEEMAQWLEGMRERLAWLSEKDGAATPFSLNIEEVFHIARFDAEVFRLRQHLEPVGRRDGPATSWNQAGSIECWLSQLEDNLRDVVLDCQNKSDLTPISRWAQAVKESDAVLTFNYDSLAESALSQEQKAWTHGFDNHRGVPIYKLHGSIDWIVADRSERFSKLDLLFDKINTNRGGERTGDVEEDYCLWRCRNREQLETWIRGLDIQSGPSWKTVGIAGLGTYKPLHTVPGLGQMWARGMQALYQADQALVVGFSMSEFDAMAQIQFAEVTRARAREGRPLEVTVIDPFADEATQARFRRVFRRIHVIQARHEEINWTGIAPG